MKIEHIAVWTDELERLKDFYINYFNGKSCKKYLNNKNNFESYFITFESGARLEIMKKPELNIPDKEIQFKGYTHIAFSVGSKNKVDELTKQFRSDGFKILGEPRTTGDGYYESSIHDPDGNVIEITV